MIRYILAAMVGGFVIAGYMAWQDKRYTRRQARAVRNILTPGDPHAVVRTPIDARVA